MWFRDDGLLARAVKEARRELKLTQRELARRSGVAASQVSRIESGEVTQPAYFTVDALAQALGKPSDGLNFLAGNAIPEEVPGLFAGQDDLEQIPGIGKPGHDRELSESDIARLRRIAFQQFMDRSLMDELGPVSGSGIEPVVTAWPGLTDARRARVIEYVEDQLALSEADRKRGEGSGREA